MTTTLTEPCFRGMAGAYAAMFTPFTKDNKVNEAAIEEIVEHGIKGGLAGFYLTGSTGEWNTLTVEERKLVYARAVKAVRGRAKLIAHVGANCTDDSVELARYAAGIGIDWLSSIAPMMYRTNFEGP